MVRFLFDILISFVVLGLYEGLIKPISVYWTKKSLLKWTPLVLKKFDDAFPDLIHTGNTEDLDKFVRTAFSELSGEDWSNVSTDYFWRIYDLRVSLSKLKTAGHSS